MRQVQIYVPRARASVLVDHAIACGGSAAIVELDDDRTALVLADVPNEAVGRFVEAAEGSLAAGEEARFVISPHGVIPLATPVGEVRQAVREVTSRSAVELTLAALQSIGSWRGLISYSVFSGAVAAYAIMFNISFLLVAAMLIAPMGAPLMVCVTGTALGDLRIFRAGLVRFVVAILILAGSAVALGTAYGLTVSTALMELVSSISGWTALIAVLGGAAGAQSLVQSDRDSLVTATATGFLVAVALSPPTAVLGLAVVIERWDYVALMAFTLLLTVTGIVVGGSAILRVFGIAPGRAIVARGSGRVRALILGPALLLLAGLVLFQYSRTPAFRKADLSYRAISAVRDTLATVPDLTVLEVSAHFTRRDLPVLEQGLFVQVVGATRAATDSLDYDIRTAATARLRRSMPDVRPYIALTLVPPPDSVLH